MKHQFVAQWSPNTHANNFLQTEWVVFKNLYTCTYKYIFAITIRGEKTLNLRVSGKELWEVWREEREERNVVTKLQSQKLLVKGRT